VRRVAKGWVGTSFGSRLSSRRWHRRGRGWGPRPLLTELDFGNERHTHEDRISEIDGYDRMTTCGSEPAGVAFLQAQLIPSL
jgi:hypothetical protein